MRTVYQVLISALVLLPALAYSAEPPSYSIRISAPENTVNTGEKVTLDIVLTNTGQTPITVTSPLNSYSGEHNYTVFIVKPNGDPVPRRYATPRPQNNKDARLWELSHMKSGSMTTEKLMPGETEEEKIVLNEHYDISVAGTYLIRVSRVDPGSGGVVMSNLIRVTVTN